MTFKNFYRNSPAKNTALNFLLENKFNIFCRTSSYWKTLREFYCTCAHSQNNIISEPLDPDVKTKAIPDAVLRALVQLYYEF